MRFSKSHVFVAVVGIMATAAAIYLTPLRYNDLIPPPPIHDVDPKVFYADFSAHPDKYIFIDVRQAAAYQVSHAAGSVNIPLQNLYDQKATLPKHGKMIVLICSEGKASGVGYAYLQHYGFTNLLRIQGGIENWIIEGQPLEGTNTTLGAVGKLLNHPITYAPTLTCNA